MKDKQIEELREKYIITDKPFNQEVFEKMYNEFTKRFSKIKEVLDENN